jgi:hypothetical protein
MSTTSPRSAALCRKTWTRVFVEVRNPRGLVLHLRRKDAIDRLLRLGNAPVGDAEFDRRFLILSRDPGYVMMIFSDRTLRQLLLRADIQRVDVVSSWLEVCYRRDERDPEHAALLFEGTVRLAEAIDVCWEPGGNIPGQSTVVTFESSQIRMCRGSASRRHPSPSSPQACHAMA